MIVDPDFNAGMYASDTVANEWDTWVHNARPDDVRFTHIYPCISNYIAQYRPHTVLEIGSGQGVSSEKIALHGAEYIGVEPSQPLRDLAHQYYPGLIFLPGRAEQLPLEDSSVDMAYSVFVWLHIQDIVSAATELARVLKHGGRFVIATANPASYDTWISWHTNIIRNGKELRGDMPRLSGHIMFLNSLEEIEQSLTQNGLVIDSMYTCGRDDERSDQPDFTLVILGTKRHKDSF